jgi:hypothetical protein
MYVELVSQSHETLHEAHKGGPAEHTTTCTPWPLGAYARDHGIFQKHVGGSRTMQNVSRLRCAVTLHRC